MSTRTQEAAHEPDRAPTSDEELAAERSEEELEESGKDRVVAEHYEEMARRGAEDPGEGRIG